MAHTIAQDCPVKEDVVISGISGRFPESDTMDEFAKKLFSGEDMVTRDDRRWPVGKFTLFCSILRIFFLLFFCGNSLRKFYIDQI